MRHRIFQCAGLIAKLLLFLIFGWPFFWLISTSFQTLAEVNSVKPTVFPSSLQFQNYADAWHFGSIGMGVPLRNSIVVIAAIIVLQVCVMLPAAYAFAKYEFRFKKLLFGCVLIALMMPAQITFLPVFLMMSDLKLINTLWPQILPFAANAFGIFMLRQYFMQIPNELIESARLDNASEGRIILSIMLPMSRPAIATIVLFSFVSHWNEYFWPLVMTNSDYVRTLPVAIAQLKEIEGMTNWHVIMAGNTVLVAPILLLYIFASKQLMNSISYSGIK